MRPALTRAGLAALLGLAATAVAAAEPESGTLTDTSGPLQYTAGPFYVPNPTPDLSLAGEEPICEPQLQNCDVYTLTVSLPENYADEHPDDTILIRVGWTQIVASPDDQPDFDVYLYSADGTLISDAGATSTNPEQIRLPVFGGTRTFEIRTLAYSPVGESIQGTVLLEKFEAQSSRGVFGAGGLGLLSTLALSAGLLLRRRVRR